MRVLHVYNRHRGGGGADNAWDQTIELSRRLGIEVRCFERDSKTLAPGLRGTLRAFTNGIYASRAVQSFDELLKTAPPDLVHTHELYPLISPFVLEVAARRRIPVVHSVYDYRITCPVATHFNGREICTRCQNAGAWNIIAQRCRSSFAENIAFSMRHAVARQRDVFRRNVSHFITLTHFSADWLETHAGITPDRISINPCAIASENTIADPAQGRFAGFAGRLAHEKGIGTLVAAAKKASIPLKLALPKGTDVASIDLPEDMLIVTQSPEELTEFYRSCRFLVVPSLWFETFAIVAAEAMAEGIPVIASDLGALRDTVVRDIAGVHVPPGDVDALAAAMTRLWQNDVLVRKLGQSAQQHVKTKFNEDAHFARLCAAYESARQKPQPGPCHKRFPLLITKAGFC